ncbi:MAG: glycoside hydrolase family 16 protein [Cloacibacterium sp.]|nr:glycoside hydrolase family 16 protein [Cloacibacterium sp.]
MPNGDGTGVVNFTVSANNAKEYKMSVDGEILTSTTGSFTYTFKQSGTNDHTVYVSAYNGDKFISGSTIVTVYVIPKAVFFDEFSVDGAPDSSKWGYDLGNNNGWGNNEAQYYTNRTQNAVVSNGTLKINLIKEAYQGYNYTSARLLSKGKYSMKYGKVEIRAKIPSGGGTWPALWMLGDNIDSVGWPACGEIDIMEHVGNQLNRIFGTLHYPGRSGGNADGASVMIPNATTEFHIYSMEWNASTIKIYVDNQLFFTYNNNPNSPFNQNFFFIMNVAMGGNFGGTIDPNVTNATMEVDYIRVYQ